MLVLHQLLYDLSTLRYTFYAFSGTNLLTRCRSASSCFLLFLVSEKLHRKYSRNWTKQKPKILFLRNEDGVRRRHEAEPGGGHTTPRRGPPLAAPRHGVGPSGAPPTLPFRLYILHLGKTLSTRAKIHEKFRRGRHRRTHLGRVLKLFPAPCRRGRSSPEASSSPCLPPR